MTGERWGKKAKRKQRKGGIVRAKSRSIASGHDGSSLKTANSHALNAEETVLCIKVIRPNRPSRARKPEHTESYARPHPRARRRSESAAPADKQQPPPQAPAPPPRPRAKSKTRDAMASTTRLRNRTCTTQTSKVLCASKSFTSARAPPAKSKMNIPSALKLINPKPVIYRVRVMSPEAKDKAKRMQTRTMKPKPKVVKSLGTPHSARLASIKYSGKEFEKDAIRKKVRIRTPIKATYGVNTVEEVLGPQPQWNNEDSEDPGEPNSCPIDEALTMAMVVANSRVSLSTDRNSTSSVSIPTLPGFYGSDKIRNAAQTDSRRGAIDPTKEFPSWEPRHIVMAKHHKRGAYFAPYRPVSRTATATIDNRGVAVCERQPPKSYPDVQRPTTAPDNTAPYTVVEVCAYDTSTTSAAVENKFAVQGRGASAPPLRSSAYRQTESSSSPSMTRRCTTWTSGTPRWAGFRPLIRSHTAGSYHGPNGYIATTTRGGGSSSVGVGGGTRGSGTRGGGSSLIPQLTAFSAGFLPRVTNSYVTGSKGNSRVSMFSTVTPPPSPVSVNRSPTFCRPSSGEGFNRGPGSLGGMSRCSGGLGSKAGSRTESKAGSRSDAKGTHRSDSRASSMVRARTITSGSVTLKT